MSTNLHVAIIQSDLVWENPIENRKIFTQKITAIQKKVALIVLPEMFTTGFSMHPKRFAETMTGETVIWLQKMAQEKDAAIVGSFIVIEKGNYYNRLLFVHPDGVVETYDKKHAFTLAGEDKVYATGNLVTIINYKGWKICPLICYDLRFPVWARNTQNYDVLLYVANWPMPRITAWNALLKARAIENMSYCIGVNRVGTDANGYQYSGNSIAIDCLGGEMTSVCEHEEKIIYVTLEKESLLKTRKKLGFLEDKDAFLMQ
ncbi:MAG: amidohydrolase [Polaribacter sp.]|nr:amidohydrolase [Polaribacter sp.]